MKLVFLSVSELTLRILVIITLIFIKYKNKNTFSLNLLYLTDANSDNILHFYYTFIESTGRHIIITIVVARTNEYKNDNIKFYFHFLHFFRTG